MKTALLLLASILCALLLSEAALRLFTPYPLSSVKVEPIRNSTEDLTTAVSYVAGLPAPPGVDRRWFTQDPPPLPRAPVKPDDLARYQDYEKRRLPPPQSFYIWNHPYVQASICASRGPFGNFPDQLMVFDPPEPTPHPIYRFPPNVTTASGLVTNQFGLRGPPLTLVKPPKVIRIAFLGASTTVNDHSYAFSYPERVVFWLNQFAQANRLDARFEVLNAGREGIGSPDIQAIVRDELLPLDPDLAVYYEGANQFTVADVVSPRILPRNKIDPHDPIVTHKLPAVLRDHLAIASLLDRALIVRVGSVGEPAKPNYRLVWPRGVDQRHPNVDDPSLPLRLPDIVHDLDRIRNSLASVGAQLAICSFEWFTPGNAPLSPIRHQYIYNQLNTVLWPLRYSDIRRVADFQNVVFRRYADSRKIAFLDVAASLPQDPNLFVDAIHMTQTGERVKAWIVFEQLAPLIHQQIESGQLPRTPHSPLPPPPPLNASSMSLRCTPTPQKSQMPAGELLPIAGGLSIYRWEQASPDAVIDIGRPLKITTPPRPYASAARFAIDLPRVPPGPVYAHLRVRVLNGQIGAGFMLQSGYSIVDERTVIPTPQMQDVYLPISNPDRVAVLLVRNSGDGTASTILIDTVELVTAEPPKK